MTSITHPAAARRIIIGVDTHKDVHVAVAIDQLGARLDERHIPTTQAGYDDLTCWATALGPVRAFGVEGTGSYGAALARHLRRHGHRVIEVNRPDRATRHRLGKATRSTPRWQPDQSYPESLQAFPRMATAKQK